MPSAVCQAPTADCRMPIAKGRMPSADSKCRVPSAECRQPGAKSQKPSIAVHWNCHDFFFHCASCVHIAVFCVGRGTTSTLCIPKGIPSFLVARQPHAFAQQIRELGIELSSQKWSNCSSIVPDILCWFTPTLLVKTIRALNQCRPLGVSYNIVRWWPL